MTQFKCIGCGMEKPLEMFYREYSHRGHTKYCKECIGKRKKEYYENNPDKAEERRLKLKENNVRHALLQRGYVERNKEKVLQSGTFAYYKNKEERILAARLHRINNPEKEYAHGVVRNAMKFGKIQRPEQCSICGKKTIVQAHHEDYSKPLDVIWLCRSCHSLHHRGVIEAGKIV